LYLTFGRHDWLVIGEFPDEKAAASAILAVAHRQALAYAYFEEEPDKMVACRW
jgi:uncharacterized protein with GYD domain